MWAIENCTDKGVVTVATDSEAGPDRMWIGGIIGHIMGVTTKSYIIKDCIAAGTLNAPAIRQVGMVTGETYETAYTKYTPADATVEFPVMGCKIDGSIVRNGTDFPDITDEIFHRVIYSDVPTVETWVPVVGEDGLTYYHGNYGVKTEGGDASEDLG